ncbi:polysaccharide pyruvyl transferase family protein [Enterococcus faecium]|uniref:polysaccharide pyruvyl transferase family protein n=1 Tax=Enterococcus faecium TaxID=1352 RepID=UPI000B756363|nr:polysaccharide pyruvyl transferase family protein [Enterococcus faecium]OTO91669.1 hypothetical protein A5836_002523 [Enterococcus faecium]OTP06628.1 hypothetical protein A5860_001312 [Enterococcus faecium]
MIMKVMLVGFIDSSNIGDRLIAETLSQLLLSRDEVKKYSYKFKGESQIEISNDRVPRSNIYDIYFKYIRSLPLVKNVVSKVKWMISQKKTYDPIDFKEFEKSLKQTDLLIIAGGNAIFDLSSATLSAVRFDRVVSLANKYQVPIFASSIGIGPFSTKKQKNAAVDTLNKCDYITFRDQRSLEYLESSNSNHAKAYASVDPVFLLPERAPFDQLKAQRNRYNKVGICIIDYRITGCSRKEYQRYLENLNLLITQLAHPDREIILFSTEIQDYDTVNSVYQEFSGKSKIKIKYIKNEKELLAFYQTLNLVIGTRMHSMIIAVSQYIPVIGLSWQQKVIEMFKNLGLEDDVILVEELNTKMNVLLEKAEQKLKNNRIELDKMKQYKNKMQKEFEINHQVIDIIRQNVE